MGWLSRLTGRRRFPPSTDWGAEFSFRLEAHLFPEGDSELFAATIEGHEELRAELVATVQRYLPDASVEVQVTEGSLIAWIFVHAYTSVFEGGVFGLAAWLSHRLIARMEHWLSHQRIPRHQRRAVSGTWLVVSGGRVYSSEGRYRDTTHTREPDSPTRRAMPLFALLVIDQALLGFVLIWLLVTR